MTAAEASVPASFEEEFHKKIRPLLDAVDRLRTLEVTDEGVAIPNIVIVGDQSSGKSCVLESLAQIRLPRGDARRVPLILRLQNYNQFETSVHISAKGTTKIIKEDEILSSMDEAQDSLAGEGKGVSDAPISLHIRRPGAPDLSIIDLPGINTVDNCDSQRPMQVRHGITRAPVDGQPEDIYEKISAMIRFYINPPDTVILNVISGMVDSLWEFFICESTKIVQQVDKEGQRTLAVITTVDGSAKWIHEKSMANALNVPLKFVFIRNRNDDHDDTSREMTHEREQELFAADTNLSKLVKANVGIRSLVRKLASIIAQIIRKNLLPVVWKVEEAISKSQRECEILTKGTDGEDPTSTFWSIVDDSRRLMENIIRNRKYDSYSQENFMHYPPRLDEMFRAYNGKLRATLDCILAHNRTDQLRGRIYEVEGLRVPNSLSPNLMASLVKEEVDNVEPFTTSLVFETHDYAKKFAHKIVEKMTYSFPTLQSLYKQDLDRSLQSSQDECLKFVTKILERERADVFTINQTYYTNVQALKKILMKLQTSDNFVWNHKEHAFFRMDGLDATINLYELQRKDETYLAAFEMKMTLAAYWTICYKRMADIISLDIKFSIEQSLLTKSRRKLPNSHMGSDLKALMEERLETLVACKQTIKNF